MLVLQIEGADDDIRRVLNVEAYAVGIGDAGSTRNAIIVLLFLNVEIAESHQSLAVERESSTGGHDFWANEGGEFSAIFGGKECEDVEFCLGTQIAVQVIVGVSGEPSDVIVRDKWVADGRGRKICRCYAESPPTCRFPDE